MSENQADAAVNYERLPEGMAMDETDINLRAHFSRMSEEKLAEYDPSWTDEQLHGLGRGLSRRRHAVSGLQRARRRTSKSIATC